MRSTVAFKDGRTGEQRVQEEFERKSRGHAIASLLFRHLPLAAEVTKAPGVQSIAPAPVPPAKPVDTAAAAVRAAAAPLHRTLAEIRAQHLPKSAASPAQPIRRQEVVLTVRSRRPSA